MARARRRGRAGRARRALLGAVGLAVVAAWAVPSMFGGPASAAPWGDGVAIWGRGGQQAAQWRAWDAGSFGTGGSTAGTGEWRIVQGAESPSRDEVIVVGVDEVRRVSVQQWNGLTWMVPSFSPMNTVSESFWWGFDVAYESQSGDALLVWNNGTTGTAGISYRVFDGSAWSAPATITAPFAGEPKHMQLAASPLTDEMVLVVSTSASADFAVVWNGSAWGNALPLDAAGGDDRTDVFAAYEQQSGEALVVYGDTDPALRSRIWNGAWQPVQIFGPPAGATGNVRWATLGADPTSNRIALGVITLDQDTWLAMWDGSAWGHGTVATGSASTGTAPNVAVAFERSGSAAIAVYGAGTSTLRYREWNAATGWGTEQAGPILGTSFNSMMLDPDPFSDVVMLTVQDDASDLRAIPWTGSGFGVPTTLEVNTGEVKNQPFVFLWEQGGSPPAPPVFDQDLGDRSDAEGAAVSFSAAATDPNGGPLTYSATGLPPGVSVDPSTGLVSGGLGYPGSLFSPYTVTLKVEDPGGLSDTDTFSWAVPRSPGLLVTTRDAVNSSGVTGIQSWSDSEVLSIGNPGFSPEPASAGTFASVIDLESFGLIYAQGLHVVATPMAIGSGPSVLLQRGDLLFTSKDDTTLTSSNTLPIKREDLVRFRPDTPGDYSQGTFQIVLDNPLGAELRAVSLIESPVRVGDVDLPAGSFLFSRSGGDEDEDVWYYLPTTAGEGTTSGPPAARLVDGAHIGANEKLWSLEVLEHATAGLSAGTILITLEKDDVLGSNNLPVSRYDVVALTFSTTTMGPTGIARATAARYLQGSDLGIDTEAERIDGLVLLVGNAAPAVTNPGAQSDSEGEVISLPIVGSDPDGDTLAWAASGLPAALTIDPSTGVISGTIDYAAAAGSPYTVQVTATDDGTPPLGTSVAFMWTIADVPRPPAFDQDLGDRTDPEGAAVSIAAPASDPDGDMLSYSASGLPPGVYVDPETGAVAGTISHVASAGSPYAVTLTVEDPGGLFDTDTFTWTVTDTPTVIDVVKTSDVVGRAQPGDTVEYTIDVTNPESVPQPSISVDDPVPAGSTYVPGSASYSLPDAAHDSFESGGYGGGYGTIPWSGPWAEMDGGPSETTDDGVVASPSCSGGSCFFVVPTVGDGTEGAERAVDLSGASSATLTYQAARVAGGGGVAVKVRGNGNPWTTLQTYVLDATDPATVAASFDISAFAAVDTMIRVEGIAPGSGRLYVDDVAITVGTFTAPAGGPPALVSGITLAPGEALRVSFAVVLADPPFSGTLVNAVTVTSAADPGGVVESISDAVNRYPVFTHDLGNRTDDEGDSVSLPALASDPDGDGLQWGATGLPDGLLIDPATGVISGTIDYGAAGASPYSVTVTVADPDGLDDVDTFTWTVNNTNRGPEVTNPGDQTDPEGAWVSLQMEASDPDGDGFTWSATGLPPGITIDPVSGLISGTVTFDAAGASPYAVTVTATDDGVPTATGGALFTWTISEVNQPPVAIGLGDRVDGEGTAVSLHFDATDPDDGTLTWSATGLPPGLSLDPATGLVTGIIAAGAESGSPYPVTFIVEDDGTPRLSDSRSFTWTVSAPELTVSLASDAAGRLQPGDEVTYTIVVTNSGPRIHRGLTVANPIPSGSSFVPGSVTVAGGATPLYADRFAVQAYDGSSGSVDWSGSPWIEEGEATDPSAGQIQVQIDGGAVPYALRILDNGIRRTADLSGEPSAELRFTYRRRDPSAGSSIGVAVRSGAVWETVGVIPGGGSDPVYRDFTVDLFAHAGGPVDLRLSHAGTVTAPGSYWFDDVRIVTPGASPGAPPSLVSGAELEPGEAMTITFRVVVDDPPASGDLSDSVSVTSGRQAVPSTATVSDTVNRYPVFSQDLGDRSDAEGDTITLAAPATDPDGDGVTWSAVGLPDGLSMDPDTGVVTGVIDFGAAAFSPFSVTLTVTDVDGLADTDAFTWTVQDTNRPPLVNDPGDQFGDEGDLVSLDVTGSDPDGDGLSWSASGLPPGLVIDPDTGVISGTISYEASSSSPYAATVTASDDGTPSLDAQVSFSWVVANTNRPPNVVSPGDQVSAEGDAVSLAVSGSDPDGNGITWSASGLPGGLTMDGDAGVISGTVSFDAAPGSPFTVIVTATDNGAPLMGSQVVFLWDVSDTNRPPDLIDPGDQASGENDAVTLAVVGSDPDGDAVTWSAAGLPDGLTIDPTSGIVSGSVTFDAGAASPYDVTVSATDDGSPVLGSQVSFTWVIAETNRAPQVTNPGDQASAEGDTESLAAIGTDPDADTLTWSATGLPGGLTIDPDTGVISGIVSYDASPASPYQVTVRAEDDGSPVLGAQVSFTWTVSDVNRIPTLGDPGNQTNPEGMWLALPVPASDPDADRLTWSATGLPGGLTIDAASGLISGTIAYTAGAGSPYTVIVTVRDDGDPSLQSQVTFTWTVNDVNLAPAVVSPGAQTSDEGDVVDLSVPASDPDGDGITWSATRLPPGLTIDADTGVISGAIGYDASPSSPYAVRIDVIDDGTPARSTSITFTWTVAEVNRRPVITPPPNQWHDEDDVVNFAVVGTDPDGDALTWSATGLPPGLSIDEDSGLVTGTLTFDAAADSPYTVTVAAADEGAPPLSAEASFTWVVDETNRAPAVTAPPNQVSEEGDTESLAVTGSDAEGDLLVWSASGLPLGLAINSSTGVISGTISYEAGAGSPHTVTVTATDDGSPVLSGSASFTWVVGNTNREPEVSRPQNQTSAEGATVSLAVTASDPDGDGLTFRAEGLPEGLSIASGTGVISGTVSYEAAAGSPHTVTVAVSDDGAPQLSAAVTFTWTVTNTNRPPEPVRPADRTNEEGDTVSSRFTGEDPDGDGFTWSAAGLPPGLTLDSVTGIVTGSLDYESAGTYPVEVTASDGTDVASVTFTWTVVDTNRPPEVADARERTDAEGDSVELAFTGSDPDGDDLTWSATGLPPGVAIDRSTGSVSGTLSYAAAGVYAVRVTATDDGEPNLSTSVSFTWRVTDVNRPPEVFDPGDRSDAEGDRVTFAVRASDPDGDEIRWAATNLPGGITINGATGVVSGVLSFDSAGTYVVTVTVTDDGSPNRTASVQFTWSVAERNRPPVLLPFGDRTGLVGEAVDVTLQASDPDGDRTTWSMSGLPTGLGYESGRISGTLLEPGVYTVSVRVTDPYGGSASGSFTWTVTAPAPPPGEFGWPVIERIPNRTDRVGDWVTLQPEAGHPDDLVVRFSAVGLPTGASLDPESGLISGTLSVADDYTVVIRVTDTEGRSAATTFLWMVELPPNEAPSAGNDEVTVDVDEIIDGVRVDVLGNDSDPEGRPLEILSIGRVPVGSVAIDGSEIVFIPPSGWTGRVSFLYVIGDDGGNEASGLVTVIVQPPAEERAGTDIAVWDDAGTELRLTPDASSDLVLGSLFQSLHVLRMPLTLLGSAVLASLLLGGLLNLGFVLHRGIPMFSRTNRRRVAVVLVPHGERLDVLDKPGAEGEVVHRFVATEAGVIATGRDRELDDEAWIEVETPAGPGWVRQRNLTEHVDAESFAEDPEVYDVLNDFIDALRTRSDLTPTVSRYGLWVAHHDAPLHYEHGDLPRIMDDTTLHTWRGRNLAYPDQRANFDVAVAGSIVDAWNHPRRELVANQPAVPSTVIPVEFTNLNAISVGADLHGPARLDQTAWLIHYSFERGHPRVIGLTKEG